MPTFDTPAPISVVLEVGAADIHIEASQRTDTVVEVRPTDPSRKADVTAAEQTRVEYAAGQLLVKAPRRWKQFAFRGGIIVPAIDDHWYMGRRELFDGFP